MLQSNSREAYISRPLKKFYAFYGTLMFITVFTTSQQLSLSSVRSASVTCSQLIYLRSILILSSHQLLSLLTSHSPSCFTIKILNAFLLLHTLKFHTANFKSRHLSVIVPWIIHIQFQSPKTMSFISVWILSYHHPTLLQLPKGVQVTLLFSCTWHCSHGRRQRMKNLSDFTNLTILDESDITTIIQGCW